MPKNLPARPNLEHLRTQAKSLLSDLREGKADAAKYFAKYLPEAANMTTAEVLNKGFRLADAQAVVARRTGFGTWPSLSRYVDRLRSMEGTWAFRLIEIDGQPLPAAMLGASHLLIDGDRFRMESPEATYEGIFTIDVEPIPHRIDIDFYEGPEAGNRCEGLFEIEEDRFRICLGLAGARRPASFVTSPGSGHALEELIRVDDQRPRGVDGGQPPLPKAPAVAVPASDTAGFDGPLTKTHERLQGMWEPVELITSGSSMQAAFLAFGSRSHEKTEARVVFGGQTMLHAQMRFREDVHPLEVDYLNLAGRSKGTITRGLFQWNGEDAVFCVAEPGAPRPSDFSSTVGSGRTLSRWRRKLA
jgi:uncharacterized protein (TIGR03067 family)